MLNSQTYAVAMQAKRACWKLAKEMALSEAGAYPKESDTANALRSLAKQFDDMLVSIERKSK